MIVPLILTGLLGQDTDLLRKLEQEWTAVARKARASTVEVRAGGLRFSGVVVSAEGHILTDASGLAGSKEATVVLPGTERGLAASDPRIDRLTGLAVVRVEARGLTPLPFAGRRLEAGAPILLCGNPYGIGTSVVHGTVAATGRSVKVGDRSHEDLLQLAAPAFPGDGGAAAIDVRGELAGLVIAGGGGLRRGDGPPPPMPSSVPYAVPADVISFVVRQLIESGEVRRGYLGVVARDLSDPVRHQLGLEGGAEVVDVDRAGPAREAVKHGDVLLRLNDVAIGDLHALRMAVWALPKDATARLRLMRRGEPVNLDVTVGRMP